MTETRPNRAVRRQQRLRKLPDMPEVRQYSKPAETRAYRLLAYLEANPQGATAAEICAALAWTESQFAAAKDCARESICPQLELTIPHPVPEDRWRYRLTGEWIGVDGAPAIAAGTGHAVAQIESRLYSVLRDVHAAKANLDPRSIDGRKVNVLTMHLGHVLAVIAEISGEELNRASGDDQG